MISPKEIETALSVLQRVADEPALIAGDERFKALVAKVHRQGKKHARDPERQQRRAHDQNLLDATAMGARASEGLAQLIPEKISGKMAPAAVLRVARLCYVCKAPFCEVHPFYHALCPPCADFNWEKRNSRADVPSRIALVTGGRIKIGEQIALRLLRDGARVVLTTRFPADAARRFAEQNDFDDWGENLSIYALDGRDLPSVEDFIAHLNDTLPHLDFLVNNAAQTLARPAFFWRELMEAESAALPDAAQKLLPLGAISPLQIEENNDLARYFPPLLRDGDGQPLDLRPQNSWRLRADEISAREALEVHLVNAHLPLRLVGGLKPLLLRSPHARRFVVNVSAMEGSFGRVYKSAHHPHTNMAKAALNMLTRTAAADFARDGIWMNSVDTGWISDEKPHPGREKAKAEGFRAPLDSLDGAMRVLDPIYESLHSHTEPIFGLFLKDYRPCSW